MVTELCFCTDQYENKNKKGGGSNVKTRAVYPR
jgi:hypothetical protein